MFFVLAVFKLLSGGSSSTQPKAYYLTLGNMLPIAGPSNKWKLGNAFDAEMDHVAISANVANTGLALVM